MTGPVIGTRFGAGRCQAVAHRGDWLGGRENTLPAVAAAVRAGADVVEIDVKLSADGVVVVLHDDTLDRLWGDPRAVADCSLAELSEVGRRSGQQIPTLEAILAMIGGTGTALMIDMDDDRWAGPSLDVVRRAISEGVLSAPEVLWCGRPAALLLIREADPEARIILSWDESDGHGELPTDDQVSALRPEAFNPHWPMITAEVLDWTRHRGLALCCWTVDEVDRMRTMIDLGVDAMITNRIPTLRTVLDA